MRRLKPSSPSARCGSGSISRTWHGAAPLPSQIASSTPVSSFVHFRSSLAAWRCQTVGFAGITMSYFGALPRAAMTRSDAGERKGRPTSTHRWSSSSSASSLSATYTMQFTQSLPLRESK